MMTTGTAGTTAGYRRFAVAGLILATAMLGVFMGRYRGPTRPIDVVILFAVAGLFGLIASRLVVGDEPDPADDPSYPRRPGPIEPGTVDHEAIPYARKSILMEVAGRPARDGKRATTMAEWTQDFAALRETDHGADPSPILQCHDCGSQQVFNPDNDLHDYQCWNCGGRSCRAI